MALMARSDEFRLRRQADLQAVRNPAITERG
jgi:hypothetical protein